MDLVVIARPPVLALQHAQQDSVLGIEFGVVRHGDNRECPEVNGLIVNQLLQIEAGFDLGLSRPG
jgi:hypothetical protein